MGSISEKGQADWFCLSSLKEKNNFPNWNMKYHLTSGKKKKGIAGQQHLS